MTTYDDIILSHGPKLYLPLDDPSGTTAVALAGSNGTYAGSPTHDVTGPDPVGASAVSFDGVNDYVDLGDVNAYSIPTTGELSIEVWFKKDSLSATKYVAGKGSANGNWEWAFFVRDTGSVGVTLYQTTGATHALVESSTGLISAGSWYHFTFTVVAGSELVLYINGAEIGSSTSFAGSSANAGAAANIGRRTDASLGYFNGDVAAFAIYDYELTADQIAQHYAAAPPPFRSIAAARASELGAVLHLPLDDVGGTVARATVGSNGSYLGGPTHGVTGPSDYLNRGISTDGSNDQVSTPVLPLGSTQPQTIEVWLNSSTTIDSSSGAKFALGRTSGTVQYVVFGQGTGDLADEVVTVFGYSTGTDDRTAWSDFTIPSGWHHHCWTYGGTQNEWIYYLDAAAVGTKMATSGGAGGFVEASIGVSSLLGGNYSAWAGIVGFTVYNRALTPAEVYENYRLGLDLGVGTSFHPVGY